MMYVLCRLPLSVCYYLYHVAEEEHIIYNDTNNCPLVNTTGCQLLLNSTKSFNPTVTFDSTGLYTLMVSLENNASCVKRDYSLKVNDASKFTILSNTQI